MAKLATQIDCPEGLSETSKQLWIDLAPHQARSPERRAMFVQALRALDRAEQCRIAIDAEGMIVQGTGGLKHIHPLIRAEKDSRAQFGLLWKTLKLTYNHGQDFNRPRGI